MQPIRDRFRESKATAECKNTRWAPWKGITKAGHAQGTAPPDAKRARPSWKMPQHSREEKIMWTHAWRAYRGVVGVASECTGTNGGIVAVGESDACPAPGTVLTVSRPPASSASVSLLSRKIWNSLISAGWLRKTSLTSCSTW